MDSFCFFEYIPGELDKSSKYTKWTGKNMHIKTAVVKIAFEKKTSFFYETKIFAEREIRKSVIDQE